MNEMVDRVAKAISLEDFNSPEGHKQGQCAVCDSMRDAARELARVAIEAMKEPTERMVKIAFNDYMSWERQKSGIPWNAKRAYNLMIQAALDDV